MGLIVYPVFDCNIATPASETTGEFLAREFDVLDEVAAERGLSGITAFADTREVPDEFDGAPDDLDEMLGPCTDWYSPTDGQAAFRLLAHLIRSDLLVRRRLGAPEALACELDDLARIIDAITCTDARFRLEIG